MHKWVISVLLEGDNRQFTTYAARAVQAEGFLYLYDEDNELVLVGSLDMILARRVEVAAS